MAVEFGINISVSGNYDPVERFQNTSAKMQTPYMAHASRKRLEGNSEVLRKPVRSTILTDYFKKMNGIVVMSGSAQRKSDPEANTPNDHDDAAITSISVLQVLNAFPSHLTQQDKFETINITEFHPKMSIRQDFHKLREPYRVFRSRVKNSQEVPASKSCKMLFDYLKLHQNKTGLNNSAEINTNLDIQPLHKESEEEWKIRRKVHFSGTTSESLQEKPLLNGYDLISSIEYKAKREGEEFSLLNLTLATKTEIKPDQQVHFDFFADIDRTKETLSSQDFMKNAFPNVEAEVAKANSTEWMN